jgi:hypothetical protein
MKNTILLLTILVSISISQVLILWNQTQLLETISQKLDTINQSLETMNKRASDLYNGTRTIAQYLDPSPCTQIADVLHSIQVFEAYFYGGESIVNSAQNVYNDVRYKNYTDTYARKANNYLTLALESIIRSTGEAYKYYLLAYAEITTGITANRC